MARLLEMGWKDLEPRNSIEEFLRKTLLRQAEMVEQVIDGRKARREVYVEQAAVREREVADRLGRTLLHDPRGPAGKYSLRRSILKGAQGPKAGDEQEVDPAPPLAGARDNRCWMRVVT